MNNYQASYSNPAILTNNFFTNMATYSTTSAIRPTISAIRPTISAIRPTASETGRPTIKINKYARYNINYKAKSRTSNNIMQLNQELSEGTFYHVAFQP
jgi:hypothetical protein